MGFRVGLLALICACQGEDSSADSPTGAESEIVDTDLLPARPILVHVTLDDLPISGAIVSQGGAFQPVTTDSTGTAELMVDPAVPGSDWILAAHRLARTQGTEVPDDLETTEVFIALTSFDPIDNLLYEFQDPGEPGRRETTAQCGHCHLTINDAWFASPHRQAATNPVMHDLYSGIATALLESDCESGVWAEVRVPGGEIAERCHVGEGVLAALNAECTPGDCFEPAVTGGCADCHSPGINGDLGGRDLLEASGFASDFGVHCDVCHRVEDVNMESTPGVSGALVLHRPSEPSESAGLGVWQPLTFGPFYDVMNPRMGATPRGHFSGGQICFGCHESRQAALLPGESLDESKWPNGLPIHSTWSEFEEAEPGVPCHSCHMPPDLVAGNAQDLGNIWPDVPGPAAGWFRPEGTVRKHGWYGPKQPESGILLDALGLDVAVSMEESALSVEVEVSNAGAGHAVPTGEPLRSVFLTVEATCDGLPLKATGGDVIPDFAGFIQRKGAEENWTVWDDAQPGDAIYIVDEMEGYYDYPTWSALADWTPDEKGLPLRSAVGSAEVVSVTNGMVVLDSELPMGTHAYLTRGIGAAQPGFAFAKVLADASGNPMVPHFLAVELVSDNRLMPGQEWQTHHRFAANCAHPAVTATLWHSSYPKALAQERGWAFGEQVMVTASASIP